MHALSAGAWTHYETDNGVRNGLLHVCSHAACSQLGPAICPCRDLSLGSSMAPHGLAHNGATPKQRSILVRTRTHTASLVGTSMPTESMAVIGQGSPGETNILIG